MTHLESSKSNWTLSNKARQRAEIIEHLKAGVMIGVFAAYIVSVIYFGA